MFEWHEIKDDDNAERRYKMIPEYEYYALRIELYDLCPNVRFSYKFNDGTILTEKEYYEKKLMKIISKRLKEAGFDID